MSDNPSIHTLQVFVRRRISEKDFKVQVSRISYVNPNTYSFNIGDLHILSSGSSVRNKSIPRNSHIGSIMFEYFS